MENGPSGEYGDVCGVFEDGSLSKAKQQSTPSIGADVPHGVEVHTQNSNESERTVPGGS